MKKKPIPTSDPSERYVPIKDLTQSSDAEFDFDIKHEIAKHNLTREAILTEGYWSTRSGVLHAKLKQQTPLAEQLIELEKEIKKFRPHLKKAEQELKRKLTREEHKELWKTVFERSKNV